MNQYSKICILFTLKYGNKPEEGEFKEYRVGWVGEGGREVFCFSLNLSVLLFIKTNYYL